MQDAFNSVYDGYWYIMGKYLSHFETMYAEFNQTNFALGVSNGLDALYLALRALDLKEGDEVIISDMSAYAHLEQVAVTD